MAVSNDEFHKEIDLIQSCISRMAQNSFMIKGWGFTLIAALIALTADKIDWMIISLIGVFVLVCFWSLDAFFLKTEKLYRFKYEWIIQEREKGNRDFLYNLNPYLTKTWLNELIWVKSEDYQAYQKEDSYKLKSKKLKKLRQIDNRIRKKISHTEYLEKAKAKYKNQDYQLQPIPRINPTIILVMFSKPYTLLLFYGSPMIIGIAVIILCILNVI
jgi:hypothetical protein